MDPQPPAPIQQQGAPHKGHQCLRGDTGEHGQGVAKVSLLNAQQQQQHFVEHGAGIF